MEPLILAVDTSCDETSATVTCGRRVLANVISSQIDLHKKYGGVYPALAKRAHEEKIDWVVEEALKRALKSLNLESRIKNLEKHKNILQKARFYIQNSKFSLGLDAVAVTQGPGLAIALEVGIRKAKEISTAYSLPLIAVNHLEGHIYSCLTENSKGLPKKEITFPALCLIVSGGHTLLALMKDHGKYEILGETLDDACGEALDKAAKILHLGYPGGPIIERLASKGEAFRSYILSQPLKDKKNLNFSYSGLKTQFLYLVQKMSEKEFSQNLIKLAYSFQAASFEQIIRKTSQAVKIYQPKTILCGGGVIANKTLRKLLRRLAKEQNIPIYFPAKKNLITDNAAMIGIAAYFKYLRKEFVENPESLDREPRMTL